MVAEVQTSQDELLLLVLEQSLACARLNCNLFESAVFLKLKVVLTISWAMLKVNFTAQPQMCPLQQMRIAMPKKLSYKVMRLRNYSHLAA